MEGMEIFLEVMCYLHSKWKTVLAACCGSMEYFHDVDIFTGKGQAYKKGMPIMTPLWFF